MEAPISGNGREQASAGAAEERLPELGIQLPPEATSLRVVSLKTWEVVGRVLLGVELTRSAATLPRLLCTTLWPIF